MHAETPKHYPSDLSESQYQRLNRLLPPPRSGKGKPGRPSINRHQLLNGLMYVVKTGCQWRQLPREFGKWQTLYGYYRKWSKSGVWYEVMEQLIELDRRRLDRHKQASAGCVDSQSVKTATQGLSVGFDGGKSVKGRKRHILTDTLGSILCVVVTAADVGDRKGLRLLLKRWFILGLRRIRKIWVDGGYGGKPLKRWVAQLKRTHKIELEVVKHAGKGKGFQLVAKRWVVERTFSWLFKFRRHSKDYELLTQNSEAMIQIAMCSILIRRLA